MYTRPYQQGQVTDPIDTRMHGRPCKDHSIQVFVTGGPSAASFNIYGSTKSATDYPQFPQDYATLENNVDALAGQITFLVDKPLNTIVIQVGTVTGGTNPTLEFGYAGK